MTRENILQKNIEMAKHNLYCYSEDYLSSRPKAGCEKEYAETKEELNILESWLKEIQNKNDSSKQNTPEDYTEYKIVAWVLNEVTDTEGEKEIEIIKAVSDIHAKKIMEERIRYGKAPKGAWLEKRHGNTIHFYRIDGEKYEGANNENQ